MAYLEDLGCLGTALVELLGGELDVKVMDGFNVVLVDEFILVLVMSNLRIFLAACETLRHILHFRSSVSCLGLG